MNLLIAEDEKRVARFLEEALSAEGFRVSPCASLAELRDWIETKSVIPDLAILDRMLRDGDTLTLLGEFKRAFPECRVLFLSALNQAEEKAEALNRGADDYMGKPFSLTELSARLRALSRRPRSTARSENALVVGNTRFDLLAHRIEVSGKRVDFSNKEFRLLLCLARRPGQVFNRFQLLDQVWEMQADTESNVVESTLKNVRRKLAEAASTLEICNRRNVGYWLEG